MTDWWMGFFLGLVVGVLRLRERVRTLEASITSHFQREHLEGDGPEIDRWRARVRTLEAEVVQERQRANKGEVTSRLAEAYAYGQRMRQDRLDRDESLREAAKRLGISPVELSALERGRPAEEPKP